ncbi:hypothetical protein, partial [Aquipseudomonas alcaligenes]
MAHNGQKLPLSIAKYSWGRRWGHRLFTFMDALAAAGALVISALLMLRFPTLLVAVVLACWILYRLQLAFRPL